LTPSDLNYNPGNPLPISEDTLQLQADTLNVIEGRVDLTAFSPERQEQIKSYYRFSAMRQSSKEQNCAKIIRSTLEAV
jgi:hypothetical protein